MKDLQTAFDVLEKFDASNDIQKAFDNHNLVKKQITDKNGKITTVWVSVKHGMTRREHEIEALTAQDAVDYHKGERKQFRLEGNDRAVKYHEQKYNKAVLNAIEHTQLAEALNTQEKFESTDKVEEIAADLSRKDKAISTLNNLNEGQKSILDKRLEQAINSKPNNEIQDIENEISELRNEYAKLKNPTKSENFVFSTKIQNREKKLEKLKADNTPPTFLTLNRKQVANRTKIEGKNKSIVQTTSTEATVPISDTTKPDGKYQKSGERHTEFTHTDGVKYTAGNKVKFTGAGGVEMSGEFKHVNKNIHSPQGYAVIRGEDGKLYERSLGKISKKVVDQERQKTSFKQVKLLDEDKHLTATEKQHILAVFNSDLNDGVDNVDGVEKNALYSIKDVSKDDSIYSVTITKNTRGLGFIGDKVRSETNTYKIRLS